MAYGDDLYRFQHNFDYGAVDISIPRKMSAEDIVDLESHFDLILKQCRRKIDRDAAKEQTRETVRDRLGLGPNEKLA